MNKKSLKENYPETPCNSLIGSDFATKDEAFEKINVILIEIQKKTLVGTFRE